MAKRMLKRRVDAARKAIVDALRVYKKLHPSADIKVQRQNNVSLRIRIIDKDFKGMDLVDRDTALWKILEPLPDSVVSQITMLLLLTPQETKRSFANVEFDYPVRSRL